MHVSGGHTQPKAGCPVLPTVTLWTAQTAEGCCGHSAEDGRGAAALKAPFCIPSTVLPSPSPSSLLQGFPKGLLNCMKSHISGTIYIYPLVAVLH